MCVNCEKNFIKIKKKKLSDIWSAKARPDENLSDKTLVV